MSNSTINDYKFVIALNKKCEPGVVINAASHMALGLVGQASEEQKQNMKFIEFTDKDGNKHANISALSLIVLRAKNGELRKLRNQASDKGLLCVDFTETMTGGTYLEQLEKIKSTAEADLTYYGVAIFGPKNEVEAITKKLSLWR